MFEWTSIHRVEDLAVSPDGRWLVAMDDQHQLQVYNLPTREFEYKIDLNVRLTSVGISQDSRHLLVNQQSSIAQLIDLFTREPVQSYTGHQCGAGYVIRSTFGGADESFVASGSDGMSYASLSLFPLRFFFSNTSFVRASKLTRNADGFIYIWHKASAQLVQKLNGHSPRCNSISWNPANPCLFASGGDDGKIKMYVLFARPPGRVLVLS